MEILHFNTSFKINFVGGHAPICNTFKEFLFTPRCLYSFFVYIVNSDGIVLESLMAKYFNLAIHFTTKSIFRSQRRVRCTILVITLTPRKRCQCTQVINMKLENFLIRRTKPLNTNLPR